LRDRARLIALEDQYGQSLRAYLALRRRIKRLK
jgi:hypothetical protein